MELSDFQKDAIREVMMIGAGHASTAMARTLKREVDIRIPSVDLLLLEDVPGGIGRLESQTIGIYTQVTGDLHGRLLTIFTKKDAMKLAEIKTGSKVKGLNQVSEEALIKIADILAISSLGAIRDFFNMTINQSHSELAYDMLGALLQQILLDISETTSQVLFSKTDIMISTEKFNCHQILFLESKSLETLLKELTKIYG